MTGLHSTDKTVWISSRSLTLSHVHSKLLIRTFKYPTKHIGMTLTATSPPTEGSRRLSDKLIMLENDKELMVIRFTNQYNL